MLGASESTARAPLLHAACTAEPEVDHHLAVAQADTRHEPWLYGALLAGRVYVTEYELVLGDHGPYVELQPRSAGEAGVLAVYTSRQHVPAGEDPLDAQALPFAVMLRTLDAGTEVEINPGGPLARRLTTTELDLLRRVLDHASEPAGPAPTHSSCGHHAMPIA